MKKPTLTEFELAPYAAIFPRSKKGAMSVVLRKKIGKARAGSYLFVEHYCVTKGCDCRQLTLLVINEKGQNSAAIDFPLDIDNPFVAPSLNPELKQSAAADDLLMAFVEVLNDNPAWYKEMRQHYRETRKVIDGVPYRGARFPKFYPIRLFEEGSTPDFESLLGRLVNDATAMKSGPQQKKPAAEQLSLFADQCEDGDWSVVQELLDNKYRRLNEDGPEGHIERQHQLRSVVYRYQPAAEELAGLLCDCYSGEDEEGIDAALRMLADVLDILRTDLERQRPESVERMEQWQSTLARRIFAEEIDFDLGAEVTGVLLSSRIEILPQLHQANSHRMLAGAEQGDMSGFSPEQVLEDLLDSLNELEVDSSFELFDALLQFLAVGESEVQIVLCSHLFFSEHPLAREAAVLMLFHPHAEVRNGIADFLAQVEGRFFSPESLRRLIVARNWFPEKLRKKLDQAIANARRARIDCAPLPQWIKTKTYASAVDGADAQSLQVVIPKGRGYLCCSMMVKKGFGVADAFLIPLQNKRKFKEFLELVRQEAGGIEVATDYIDQRLCQALEDGARADKVPNHWLVAIAEQLGCDQWNAASFDPYRELTVFRDELKNQNGQLLTEETRRKALNDAAFWPERMTFAHSWFEDDAEVDRTLEAVLLKKRRIDPMEPLKALFEKIMEPRRAQWLERLVLTTAWLKSAKKAPVPWEQMFHVAEAVADLKQPLEEIPLMITIAENSLAAYLARLEDVEGLQSTPG